MIEEKRNELDYLNFELSDKQKNGTASEDNNRKSSFSELAHLKSI
jgi:hypothetical protein